MNAKGVADEVGTVYLKVEDVALMLNVSASLVYQWVEEKRIAHFRFGGDGRRGAIRFLSEEVRAFTLECRAELEDD